MGMGKVFRSSPLPLFVKEGIKVRLLLVRHGIYPLEMRKNQNCSYPVFLISLQNCMICK
jgi:hypothetical protein